VSAVVLLTLLDAAVGQAAEPAASPRMVVLSTTDPTDTAPADAIRAHLAGLPVTVVDAPPSGVVSEGAGPPSPCAAATDGATLAAVCVERRRSGELLVSLREGGGATTLVRRIEPGPTGSGATLEELGVAVRSLVQALLEGGHVGIAGPTPGPPPATLGLRLGYIGTLLSTDIGWQSGVDAEASWRIRGPFAVAARYSFFPSIAASLPGSTAVLVLDRHPIELAVGWSPRARIAPEAWLGAWADLVHRSTAATGADLNATGDQSDWSFGASAAVGVAWAPVPVVHLHALGGLDLAFRSARYVVDDGGGATLTLASLRPRLQASIGVDVW
jgi:hypothetical protein